MIEFINSKAASAANLPFSQAVRSGNTLYLSGAIGNIPGKMELAPGGIEAESRQMMENITAVLRRVRPRLRACRKVCRLFRRHGRVGRLQQSLRPLLQARPLPARTAIGAHQLILNARVEMECVAMAG